MIHRNSIRRRIIPATAGMKNARKSGRISFQLMIFLLNRSRLPRGKIRAATRPFPNAQLRP